MKKGKAVGRENICIELIIALDDNGIEILKYVIQYTRQLLFQMNEENLCSPHYQIIQGQLIVS